ncbi:hypothetical protein QUC31_009224 [Theobroma cacao]
MGFAGPAGTIQASSDFLSVSGTSFFFCLLGALPELEVKHSVVRKQILMPNLLQKLKLVANSIPKPAWEIWSMNHISQPNSSLPDQMVLVDMLMFCGFSCNGDTDYRHTGKPKNDGNKSSPKQTSGGANQASLGSSSFYACFNSSSRSSILCFGSSFPEPEILNSVLKPSSSKFTAASSPFREDA